jgi:hypothetical protein
MGPDMGSGEDPYLGDLIAVARVQGFQERLQARNTFFGLRLPLQVMLCRIWKRL